MSEKFGVLRPEGFSERAIFIIDRNGIIRYMDIHDIAQQPSNDELCEALRVIDPQAAADEPRREVPLVDLPHGGIVMYCTRWCSDCKNARAWLKAHNLPYTEVDITLTPGAAQQVQAWAGGNRTTPTFDIDGTIIVDFDEARLRQVLNIRD